MQAKSLAELLGYHDPSKGSKHDIFAGRWCWFTYAVFVYWLVTVGVWLVRMNNALALFDPIFIIPLLQVGRWRGSGGGLS